MLLFKRKYSSSYRQKSRFCSSNPLLAYPQSRSHSISRTFASAPDNIIHIIIKNLARRVQPLGLNQVSLFHLTRHCTEQTSVSLKRRSSHAKLLNVATLTNILLSGSSFRCRPDSVIVRVNVGSMDIMTGSTFHATILKNSR